ncbi:MAG: hypothetical protein IID51_10155 [Proteobacteria bacterium]|nr:hypothetical protein [Pseudomonadota bacterium]
MISGIGISPVLPGPGQDIGQGSAVAGTGRTEQSSDSAPSKPAEEKAREKAEEKTAGRVSDPVTVKPDNIGGESAIAAQIEASRPDADKATEKPREKSGDDTDAAGLTEEERAVVKKLAARDREVRAHESAHQAVGGPYTGAASFTFQQGPDGRRYAVGGEVPIDASAVPGDPDATIRKLRTVRRAALAPAEPSAQDRSIASSAEAGVRAAQTAKRAEATEERRESAPSTALQQPSGEVESSEAGSENSVNAQEIRRDIQA